VDIGQQEVVNEDEELVRVRPLSLWWLPGLDIVAYEMALGESQSEVNGWGGRAGGGIAGLFPGPEAPPCELDGEMQQHGGARHKRESRQDRDPYQPSAVDDGKRAEIAAHVV
jgi:hypothetical protein